MIQSDMSAKPDTEQDGADPSAEQDTAGHGEAGDPAEGSDPAQAGADPQDQTPEDMSPEDRVQVLVAENSQLRDQILRLMADMENLRRRTEREKADTANYAISNFARDVLGINDNLDRAISAVPPDALEGDANLKALHEGVLMTGRELINMLERYEIKMVNPEGERFDPNLHQAMFELENPNVPAGMVIQVMQPGYMIGERVLRPAMVGVAKGGPKEAKTPEPGGGDPMARSDTPPGEAE